MDMEVVDNRKRKDEFWIYKKVFDMNVKPATFMVYCFLLANEGSNISVQGMAKLLKMPVEAIQNALNELENLNMIKNKKGNLQPTHPNEWMRGGRKT